jgi:hypothetical protein
VGVIKNPVESGAATVLGFRSPFIRGFGNVLAIHRCEYDHAGPRFVYRGRDIAKITSADAISQDWKFVGSSIASAFSGLSGTDGSDSDQ